MTAMQANIGTLTLQLAEANSKLVEALIVSTTLKEQLAARSNNGGQNRGNSAGRGNGGRGGGGAQPVFDKYC